MSGSHPAKAVVPTIAYLASGQLYLRRPGAAASQPIESDFANRIRDRETQQAQRSGWRDANPIWGSMQQMDQGWFGMGRLPQVADQRRAVFGSVAPAGADAAMLYVLHTDSLSGLFEFTPADGYERRLVHRQGFHMRDMRRHPRAEHIAFSMEMDDGTAHLGLADGDGRKPHQITDGDCRDESPEWLSNEGTGPDAKPSHVLFYQSAGVGRDPHGYYVGLGPYRIERLDLDTQEVRTMLASDDHDYLQPRAGHDGTLLAIRRPHQPDGRRPTSALDVLKDAVLFPWRLIRAVFYFLNYFAMIFAGKPLGSAGAGEGVRRPDPPMVLWGRLIQAKQYQRASRKREPKPLVPRDWELILARGDDIETLAEHVVSFDVCPEGVVYTDGHRVRFRDWDGRVADICKDRMIQQVAALEA